MQRTCSIMDLATVLGVLILVTIVNAQTKCNGDESNLPHICQHITLRQPSGLLITGGEQDSNNCTCRIRPKNDTDQTMLLTARPLHPEQMRRISDGGCNLRISVYRHTRRRNGTDCPIIAAQRYGINSGNPITVEFMHDKSRKQTPYCVEYSIPTSDVNEVEVVCNKGTVPFEGIAEPGEEDVPILKSKAFIIGVSVAGGILLLLIIIIIVITCRHHTKAKYDMAYPL